MVGPEREHIIKEVGPVFLDWTTVNVPRQYDIILGYSEEQVLVAEHVKLADYKHGVYGFALAMCCDNNPYLQKMYVLIDKVTMTSETQFTGVADEYTMECPIRAYACTWPIAIIDRAEISLMRWSEATIGEVDQQ